MAYTAENNLIIEDGVVKNGKMCVGEITVPEGVRKLGKYMVSGCTSLKYVQAPDSVCEMDDCTLMRKFESDVGFTHAMEDKAYYPDICCHEDSWIAEKMQAVKDSDNRENAHGTRHFVEIVLLHRE